jgi:small subunit ribosomal protein S11
MAEDTTKTTAPVEEVTTEVKAAPAPKRKKIKRSVPHGQVHILASFNNTIVTVTDSKGGTLTYSSAGAMGFRGSKKGTAYAAQVAAEKALSEAKQNHGLTKADVFVRGIGLGRDTAIRALASSGIALEMLHDVTGVPHGGVRPRKAKRN